jgi:hypothetical protein
MSVADSNKKTVGKPFPKGKSGNPKGRVPGSKNAPKEGMTIARALSVVELAAAGRTPRQIARLLKARPAAVKDALSQSRRLLEVCSPRFAEHWLRASEVAAEDGDHKPAMAALQSIKVVEPVAQTYDTANGAKAVAGVQVQFVGFSLPGLPQPQPAIDVTATTETKS